MSSFDADLEVFERLEKITGWPWVRAFMERGNIPRRGRTQFQVPVADKGKYHNALPAPPRSYWQYAAKSIVMFCCYPESTNLMEEAVQVEKRRINYILNSIGENPHFLSFNSEEILFDFYAERKLSDGITLKPILECNPEFNFLIAGLIVAGFSGC